MRFLVPELFAIIIRLARPHTLEGCQPPLRRNGLREFDESISMD